MSREKIEIVGGAVAHGQRPRFRIERSGLIVHVLTANSVAQCRILGQDIYSHSAFFTQVYNWVPVKFNTRSSPALDWSGIQHETAFSSSALTTKQLFVGIVPGELQPVHVTQNKPAGTVELQAAQYSFLVRVCLCSTFWAIQIAQPCIYTHNTLDMTNSVL